MSKSYTVKAGDTLESIARVCYGDEKQASLIRGANPDTSVLIVGSLLFTPDQQGVNGDATPPQSGVNEVSVLIGGKWFKYWTSISITQSIDAFSTVSLTAPFEASREEFRNLFRPFTFADISVYVGSELLFSGTMIGVTPEISPKSKRVSVTCYSKAGVLNDCTAPASAFPLEFNKQTLYQIAEKLCEPFGINVVYDDDTIEYFESVACKPDKRIFSFLSKLAGERGLIISNESDGSLLFHRSVSGGNPVAILRQGESPLIDVTPQFNPQSYYSHITGLESVKVGSDGAKYTVKNYYLEKVLRPLSFSVDNTDGGNTKAAVNSKIGRMFGNMASYTAKVCTWRDPKGELWRPNTTIELKAPDAMIYRPYEFIIRKVKFVKESSEFAELDLVVIGSFSGEIPESLPWEG